MFKWLENWRDRFIEDCAQWWKMWSSWLAIFWGVIVTAVWNSPETLSEIVNVMPESIRAWFSPIVLGLVAGLPILVRLIKQQKLVDAVQAKKEGKE